MLRTLSYVFVPLLCCVLFVSVGSTQELECDAIHSVNISHPALCAEQPFENESAIRRLIEVFPDLAEPDSESTLETLREIIRYSYEFASFDRCPYSVPEHCFGSDYIAVRRVVVFPIDGITEDIVAEVAAREQSGCSSVRFPNTALISVQRLRLIFGGGIHARKFFCDNILGKHLVGEARGHWSLSIPISVTGPTQFVLRPVVGEVDDLGIIRSLDPITDYRLSDRDLLGFIDIDTFFGRIFNTLFVEFDLSPIKILLTWFGESTPTEAIQDFSREIMDLYRITPLLQSAFDEPSEAFLEIVGDRDPLRRYEFFIDANRTGFHQMDLSGSDIQYHIVQVTYVPREVVDLTYGFFAQDVELIDSWSDADGRTVEIGEGDTFWQVAENIYGRGELHSMLSHFNPHISDSDLLWPGEEVNVPPLWRIVELHRSGSIVERGDTLWARYIEEESELNWSVWLNQYSDLVNPDLVMPGQVVVHP